MLLQRSSELPACATPERPVHFFVVCATFVALTRATRRTNWMAMNMPASSAIVRGADMHFWDFCSEPIEIRGGWLSTEN